MTRQSDIKGEGLMWVSRDRLEAEMAAHDGWSLTVDGDDHVLTMGDGRRFAVRGAEAREREADARDVRRRMGEP